MQAGLFKRAIAYIIDALIIIVLSSTISSFIVKDNSKLVEEQEIIINDVIEQKKDINEIKDRLYDITYQIEKNNIPLNLITFTIMVLYMGVYQAIKGQTLGKKVLKIKLNGDYNMNLVILRSLIVNGIIFGLIKIMIILIAKQSTYFYFNVGLSVLDFIVYMTIVFMIMFRNDKRGLHDLICKTSVVKEELNETV